MARENLLQQWAQAMKEMQANQPALGAEVKAMTREAVKDVRNTIHEVFFGKNEHMAEAGTPLNPTPQLVTAGLTGKKLDYDLGR